MFFASRVSFDLMAKKTQKKAGAISELQRYLLIGAGFGLYFGWFFTPQREPTLSVAITRTILAAVVMFLFQLYQQGRGEFQTLLRKTPLNVLQLFVFFAVLEVRRFFYEIGFGLTETHLGGRSVTAVVLIVIGVALAGLYYWRNRPQ